MPRQYEMSWEGAPAYRWRKMFKGVMYRVSCEELRAPVWTKEATGKLANQWWRTKLATLTGPSPLKRQLDSMTADMAKLKADVERGQVARPISRTLAADGPCLRFGFSVSRVGVVLALGPTVLPELGIPIASGSELVPA